MRPRAERGEQVPRELMVKPIDAWWTVLLVDPIATRVVPRLSRISSVTPTRITLLAHLLGIGSALLFAHGLLVQGAIVYELRFVLDCTDGKLARVTGRSSVFGHLLDSFGDRVLFVANAAVLGWRHAPIAVLLLATANPLQFHLVEARQELMARAGTPRPIERMLQHGWGQRLARHRLFPFPTSVDVEHLLLFAGPMMWAAGFDVITLLLWVTAVYVTLQCVRYGTSLLRGAAALDRMSPGGSQSK